MAQLRSFKHIEPEALLDRCPRRELAKEEDQDEETTLASYEEYQSAHHDMGDEDDSQSEKSSGSKTTAVEERASKIVVDAASSSSNSNHTNKQPTHSLASLRRQFFMGVGSSQPASPESPSRPQQHSNLSESSSFSESRYLESASSQQQFEIRWRNIHLFARQPGRQGSALWGLSWDSLLTKLRLREPKALRAAQSPRFRYPYSPPLNHKAFDAGEVAAPTPAQLGAAEPELAGYRPILSNLNGSVLSGQLTAILGPSGVGKTSLLNSLTGRNQLEGRGYVELHGCTAKRLSVVTVPQVDVLPAKLTVHEDLHFSSRLKCPKLGVREHERNVARAVRLLQLEKCLNTQIDKLSGGEARRLSIGRELLSSPDIMILDEPTSGLDANTSKKIIQALRDIVERNDNPLDRPMSIIATIHQPQREVYYLFHRVYVMAVGGRAIYEGPPGELLGTLLSCSSLGQICPPDQQLNENPAIVALEVASGEYGPRVIEELAQLHELQQTVYESTRAHLSLASLDESPPLTPKSPLRSPLRSPRILHARPTDSPKQLSPWTTPRSNRKAAGTLQWDRVSAITSVSYASTYDADLPEPISRLKVDKRLRRSVVMKSDFLSQTWTLMRRSWLLTVRDLFLMSIRVLGFLLVAAGTVQIFSHVLSPDEHQCPVFESEVDDIGSFMSTTRFRLLNLETTLRQASSTHLFFFHVLLCFMMVTSALTGLVFPLQTRMFLREYKNGWYSPASFVTSITLAELPVDLLGPALALAISYPLCNQPESAYHWRELGYILVISLAAVICKSQAHIAAAFLKDSVENSVFVSCVLVTGPALLSGVAVRIREMSWTLQQVSYGSFLRYALESLMLLRYGYGMCPCDSEFVHGYPPTTSTNAIPPNLERLATAIMYFGSGQPNSTSTSEAPDSPPPSEDNLFVSFIRLVSSATNLNVPSLEQLGECTTYRSLYLMDMGIDGHVLPLWISIMFVMFLVSRILTYFTLKAVIKLDRS